MGKVTGFLDYAREENKDVPVEERIKNFKEFHIPLTEEERRKQGARCMNCGVPFCQSGMKLAGMFTGCPLHNLCPEWNDEVYNGHVAHALSRLLKTNNFPEFTGRVCPALCEKACVEGLDDAPVTTHDNELYIIETAFQEGYLQPRIPEVRSGKRVAVIGAGPAGLAVADQLNHRGHSVTVFEREDAVGGLLMYGIPNMKLDKRVVDRRVKLMEAEGVVFRTGCDVGGNTDPQALLESFDALVLCCGSKTPRDLNVPGREAQGIHFAVDYLTSATRKVVGKADSFAIDAKGKDVIIVGGGDTGNDCVGTAIRQGCCSVTQLEMMACPPEERLPNNPWPQWPRVKKTDYGQQEAIAVFGQDPRIYKTTVKEIKADEEGNISSIVTVRLEGKQIDGRFQIVPLEGSEEERQCGLLLIAAGFTGCQSYVAEAFGLARDNRGSIVTAGYRTENPRIFAAGDCRRGQSLVVWAITEGRACAKEVDQALMGYTNLV